MRIGDRIVALPAREGARAVALRLLAEATEAAERLAAGKGEEPLHDFRVAVRRLRTALRSLRPWLDHGVRRRHERKLEQIARSTNAARDAEVQLAWLSARRSGVSAPRRAGHDFAVARLQARLQGRPDAARVAGRFRRTAGRLRRRLDRCGRKGAAADREGATFGTVLASLVRERASSLAARVEAIRDPADQDGAHRARIAAKRLRYLLEPLGGYRGTDAAPAIARLKRLQEILGDLHDAHVLAAELGAALVDAAAEGARQLHASALAPGSSGGAGRDRLRASPRPGLLALLRLLAGRRDELFGELERERRAGTMDALLADVRAVATALEPRQARPDRAREATRTSPARRAPGRAPPASSSERGRPGDAAPPGRPPGKRPAAALRRATSVRARAPGIGSTLR